MKKSIVVLIIGFILGSFSLVFANEVTQFTALKASFSVYVNGKVFTSDKPIVTINGSTYMPLRAIGDVLGTKVNWNEGLRRVEVGETQTSTVNSRQNPAAIGTSLTVDYDYLFDKYKANIKLEKIIRGSAAWDLIKNANQFNSEAKEGYEYILAKINFELTEGEKQYDLSAVNAFKLISSAGKEYDMVLGVAPEPTLDAKLYKGSSNNGYVVFQVEKTDSKPLITFGRNYDGTGGIWFKAFE